MGDVIYIHSKKREINSLHVLCQGNFSQHTKVVIISFRNELAINLYISVLIVPPKYHEIVL